VRIQTNTSAVNTNRQLGINDAGKAKSTQQLSSGYRANSAEDDAADLVISEKMRAQKHGLSQASRNTQDGISLLQVGDGGLQIVHDLIHRMRELSVQAAGDTNVLPDREAIQQEIDSLTSEINVIADNTEFNTRKLFDGSVAGTHRWNYGIKDAPMIKPMDPALHNRYQTAASQAEAYRIDSNASVASTRATVEERMSDKPEFLVTYYSNSGTNWTPAITIRDASKNVIASVPIAARDYNTVNEFIVANHAAFRSRGFFLSNDNGRLVITSASVREDVTVGDISISGQSGHDWQAVFRSMGLEGRPSENFITGTTYPEKSVEDQPLWIQSGANNGQGKTAGIPRLNAQDLGLMLTASDMANPWSYNGISTVFGISQYRNVPSVNIAGSNAMGFSLDVTTREKASAALGIMDNALYIISEERAHFSASTNRLEFAGTNVDKARESVSAPESRIRDADMAKEMTELMRRNILSHASTAMLAQANALPQGVLQLLS